MHSRKFRLVMIAFTAVWFGVVLPGHERGVITVPSSTNNESCGSCESESHCAVDSDPAGDKSLPQNTPASRCAICKFIGTLDLPVLVTLTSPVSEQIAVLNWAAPKAVCVLAPIEQTSGRAPPLFA